MHGLVHRSIRSLVVQVAGNATWEVILRKGGMDDSYFIGIESYTDEQTHALIGHVCTTLGLTLDAALQAVGRHWVSFVNTEGYGPMLSLFGSDVRSCLKNLNQMHAHMGTSLKGIQFPRFALISESSQDLVLEYRSQRAGMYPLLLGLLEGLGEFYQEMIELVPQMMAQTGASHDRVQVRFLA
jgi:hypothetical protein